MFNQGASSRGHVNANLGAVSPLTAATKDIKHTEEDEDHEEDEEEAQSQSFHCILVGGLEHDFYFPFSWEFHHPI